MLCQLINEFGRTYVNGLCHWSYGQYQTYVQSCKSKLSSDFPTIKEKSGANELAKLTKGDVVTDPTVLAGSEREQERELCSVTKDGYAGLMEQYAVDYKVLDDHVGQLIKFE